MTPPSRRALLATGLTAIGTGLSGCLGDDGDDEEVTDDDDTDDVDDTDDEDDVNGTDDTDDEDDTDDDDASDDDTGEDDDEDDGFERLRFVVISDGHWGADDPGEDHFRFPDDEATGLDYEETHARALEQIEAVHEEHEVDFLVDNGDVVHDHPDLHHDKIDKFYSELPDGIDWYPTFGNHDWSYDDEWEEAYGHPKQHTVEIGSYGIILTETGLPRSAEHGSPANADPQFIEESIDAFEDQGKDMVFGFQHIAPYPSRYGQAMPNVQEQWARDSVAAVFCGHNHDNNEMHIEGGQRYFQVELTGNRMVHVRRGIRVVDVYEEECTSRQLSYDGDVLHEVTFDPLSSPE